jgi:oligopeptide/dipeptide ABC transporter ATP-binding protein
MPEPVIEVSGLTKHFKLPGEDKVVKACTDVSFAIEAGRTLGLVGESGSGKTTVGRCLVRLLEIDGGSVAFRGEQIGALSRRRFRPYRRDIQIVFQEPFESLNPLRTVEATIEEPLRALTDLSAQERERRVAEVLEEVGLPAGAAGARPGELSAGDQQRVAIGRALVSRPAFVVLDEPTSALPPDARPAILALLKRLQSELDLAYLFISHDLSSVQALCDDVAVMYLGQIVERGTREEVLVRPRHPYSRALLSSVLLPDPERGRLLEDWQVSLAGEIPSPVDLPTGCFLEQRCPYGAPRCGEPQELAAVAGEAGRVARCWRAQTGEWPESSEAAEVVAEGSHGP